MRLNLTLAIVSRVKARWTLARPGVALERIGQGQQPGLAPVAAQQLDLAVGQVPGIVRIARGEALMLREQDFVGGAVADGARPSAIMFRYLLPNSLNALIVQATVAIPVGIIGEAVLSFLGLGARPPSPEWGAMVADGARTFDRWWIGMFPGLAILSVVMAFNFLGDSLRDALDPRTSRAIGTAER